MHKVGHTRGFSVTRLGPLLEPGLPSRKNVLKPMAKKVLIPLGLTAAALVTDAAIQKKNFGSGHPSDLASCVTVVENGGIWCTFIGTNQFLKIITMSPFQLIFDVL